MFLELQGLESPIIKCLLRYGIAFSLYKNEQNVPISLPQFLEFPESVHLLPHAYVCLSVCLFVWMYKHISFKLTLAHYKEPDHADKKIKDTPLAHANRNNPGNKKYCLQSPLELQGQANSGTNWS